MELVHEFTFRADLGDTHFVGPTPDGVRAVAAVTGGWIRGERINGVVVGPGGDWARVGADGYARLDVRIQFRTDDGAVIYGHYEGLLELDKFQPTVAAGAETSYDDGYFRTTPRLQTGDERYAWVNRTLFVARGRMLAGAVEYEVFRLT